MKNLLILLAITSLIGCSKEKQVIEPIITTPVVKSVLTQTVDGDVKAESSCTINIYEDMGNGVFEKTIINQMTWNEFPTLYTNEIKRPFYFEVTVHNSSKYENSGKGAINVAVDYNGKRVIYLEVDENTWSDSYTSVVYNE